MGEIADALRRAKHEAPPRNGDRSAPDRSPDGSEETEPVYSRALELEAPQQVSGGPSAAGRADSAPREVDAHISRERTGDWQARTVVVKGEEAAAESYRHFAIRLARELDRQRLKSVMLVSALLQEGKTTTSCNLALAFGSMGGGRRIALLDCDLRRPRVAISLGIEPRAGLETVLEGRASLDDACVRTDLPGLDVYPVAMPLPRPHEILASSAISNVFADFEARYDTIIVDTAPLLLVPDAELLFPHIGGAIAVMRSRQTKRAAFEKLVELIPDGKLIGSFMNDSHASSTAKKYGYYGNDKRSAQPQST